MNLGELLLQLKDHLSDPVKNRDAIVDLLRTNAATAESEVARFYVASHIDWRAVSEQRLTDRDPRERLAAVRGIDFLVPRGQASRLLRMVVKDPDLRTRSHARHKLRLLELTDVSLPDRRFKVHTKSPRPTTPGAWNPTGWSFGIYGRKLQHGQRVSVLKKHGAPELKEAADMLTLLGISGTKELRALQRPGAGLGAPYIEFEVDKRSGGKRIISAPRASLRKVQRAILDRILAKAQGSEASHGFTAGRSTVTNAAPHVGAKVIVKMDLVDFFPSIHFRRVEGLFSCLGYGAEVAHLLASLCTFRPVLADGMVVWPGILPQGAPTSPAIANLVSRRLDARLARLSQKAGAVYTRYADDLTFSFAAEPANLGRFLWWVDQICQQEGFRENTKKRRVLRKQSQQRITGVVVNEKVSIPRKDRRRFRAILNNVKKNGLEAEARGRTDFADYLRGYAAYVHMVQPELGTKWVAEVAALTERK